MAPGLVRSTQIDALAHVLLREVAGDPVDLAAHAAGHVTFGRFDLHHVGAEVGQDAAGERTGEDAGEVEHLDAVEQVASCPINSSEQWASRARRRRAARRRC